MPKPRKLRSVLFQLAQVPMVVVLLLLIGINLLQVFFSVTAVVNEQQRLVNTIEIQASQDLNEIQTLLVAVSQLLQNFEAPLAKTETLDLVRKNYPFFQALYFTDAAGIVSYESSATFSLLGLDTSGNEYYRQALATRQPYISDPFISLGIGLPTVDIAVPVSRAGQVEGILVAELDLVFIQNTVTALDGITRMEGFVLDKAGNLVAHPNPVWVAERRNLSHIPFIQQALQAPEDEFGIFYDQAREQWLVGSTAHMQYDWLVVVTQPLFEVITPVLITMGVSLLVFLISLAVFFWSQYYSVELLTRPIADLAQKTDLMAQGHYEISPVEAAPAIVEVGSLSHSFTQMVEAVQQRTLALEDSNRSLEIQIREREQAEAEVRKLNTELEQRVFQRTAELAAANKELEAFSYSVSHDLRAPLRGITGFSQLLEEDAGPLLNAEAKDHLRHIRENSLRMNNLIEALLSLAKVTRAPLHRAEVDLSDMAFFVAETLQASEPEREITWQLATGVRATGDAALLQNLLQNLLGNAWKFTSKQAQPVIEFGALEQAGRPVYFVRDNGAGFEMEFAGKLFGAFQRLHSAKEFEGTGIGLATVQRIVNRHGGKIWAEGQAGAGAVFYFTLEASET